MSDMNRIRLDAARASLFTVDETSLLLDVDGAEFFHSRTTLLLFAAN